MSNNNVIKMILLINNGYTLYNTVTVDFTYNILQH